MRESPAQMLQAHSMNTLHNNGKYSEIPFVFVV